ncbi:uncharacterized protein BN783_00532 [Odoribacter sp. CAG:788]|jgi:hypothetical protein|nr:uncharacterized protein BN783_00532 [Odoribacter sp. CAG:788]
MKTAIYNCKLSDYQGGYTLNPIKVEILDESDKSYRVKYLEPGAFGQYVGTTKWVRKYSVCSIVETNVDASVRPATRSGEIRLPYKD